MDRGYVLLQILTIAVVTAFIRALPFWIFRDDAHRPAIIDTLGRLLPPATMGLLIVYCLRNTEILTGSHGIPELIALLTVIGLHRWKHSVLLSIFGSTAVYMVLINTAFA